MNIIHEKYILTLIDSIVEGKIEIEPSTHNMSRYSYPYADSFRLKKKEDLMFDNIILIKPRGWFTRNPIICEEKKIYDRELNERLQVVEGISDFKITNDTFNKIWLECCNQIKIKNDERKKHELNKYESMLNKINHESI